MGKDWNQDKRIHTHTSEPRFRISNYIRLSNVFRGIWNKFRENVESDFSKIWNPSKFSKDPMNRVSREKEKLFREIFAKKELRKVREKIMKKIRKKKMLNGLPMIMRYQKMNFWNLQKKRYLNLQKKERGFLNL